MLRRICVGTLLFTCLFGCTTEVGQNVPSERFLQHSREELSGQSWQLWMPAPGSVTTDTPACFEPNNGFNSSEKSVIRANALTWTGVASRVTFTGWGECVYGGARGSTPPGIHVSK